MDRLEFLVRRFRQIVPQPLTDWDPVRARLLQCWLRDDVGPVLHEYAKRPRFRLQAAWPIRTLRPGAGTAERALVDQVDSALVAQSQALYRFSQLPQARKLLQAVAVAERVTEEDVLLGEGKAQVTRRIYAPYDQLALMFGQMERMAGRFWQDLVNMDDYFEPIGAWMTPQRSDRPDAELIVALNPELHPGGDFISRCLSRRVETLWGTLADFGSLCDRAFRESKARTPKGWKELSNHQGNLLPLIEQLRHACLQGDQQPLRDACILLTQVHAALEPNVDLGWLELPETTIRRGAAIMDHRLRSCHGELLERLAVSLGELQQLYADGDPQQNAVDEAVASGGLVLVRSLQHVYWQGKRIEVSWNRYHAHWRFLLALAEKGRRAAVVEDRDLYENAVGHSTLATRLSRLKRLVPATLWKQILPSKDPRGYRLNLERPRIHLF